MGRWKKAGICVGVALAVIIVVAVAPNVPNGYKYQGLTDQQIKAVESFRTQCDTQAFFAEGYGPDAAKRVTDKCDQLEAQKIVDYRSHNAG